MRAGLLFDLYGALLTDHQQDVWQLYYLDDLSLAEIAESRQISRAAVYDLLDRTEKLLEDYEARLGLLVALERRRQRMQQVFQVLADMSQTPSGRAACSILAEWADEEGLTDV